MVRFITRVTDTMNTFIEHNVQSARIASSTGSMRVTHSPRSSSQSSPSRGIPSASHLSASSVFSSMTWDIRMP